MFSRNNPTDNNTYSSSSSTCSPSTSGGGVAYYYDPQIAELELSEGHFMRPYRLQLLFSLVQCLGLESKMDMCVSNRRAVESDMTVHHSEAYIEFLRDAKSKRGAEWKKQRLEYQILLPSDVHRSMVTSIECPLFDELWEYVSRYVGATLDAVDDLLRGDHRICINWSGGMHHGQKERATGFCYVNDIVIAIARLLEKHERVLYIDIDVHHGDGVEAAFRGNPRVVTLSLHQHGNGFFPGTGSVADSRNTTVNVPLWVGTTDDTYATLFRVSLGEVVSAFDPNVVVMQAGADTIAGDRLGHLNVSTRTHGLCVDAVVGLGLPVLLLGGGGYNITHTARCWAWDTAVACGLDPLRDLPQYIPGNRFSSVFEQDRGGGPCPLFVGPDATIPRRALSHEALQLRRLVYHIVQQMAQVRFLRYGRVLEMPVDSPTDGLGKIPDDEQDERSCGYLV